MSGFLRQQQLKRLVIVQLMQFSCVVCCYGTLSVHKIGFACQRRNESLMNREVNGAKICGPVHANKKR